MFYEFKTGVTRKINNEDFWKATVDHKTPEGGATGVWYSQIVCYGNSEANADALRDRVLDALQDEGKLAVALERAEKAEGLIRMLAINALSVPQLKTIDAEQLEQIEAIIKMPGMRDDS